MFLIAYCFEGRLAHQTLGMLLTRRLARAGAAPLGFVASDYAIAIWCANAPPADISALFAQEMLGDDLEAWMAESSMLRRTFRNVAVVAGLIERQHPGVNASRRQVTVNTDLIYDVLRRHQPDHVLLRATRQEAAGGLTDIGRLGDLLARIEGRVRVMRLDRVSPLAVPVMLDIGREHVRDEDAEDSLLAETEALIAEATGLAEPSMEEMRIAPGHVQELRAPDPATGTASTAVSRRRRPTGAIRGLMIAAPLHLAGERVMLDPAGVLYWPAAKLLAVADLHLEKGTAAAGRGALVPPLGHEDHARPAAAARPALASGDRGSPWRQLPRPPRGAAARSGRRRAGAAAGQPGAAGLGARQS